MAAESLCRRRSQAIAVGRPLSGWVTAKDIWKNETNSIWRDGSDSIGIKRLNDRYLLFDNNWALKRLSVRSIHARHE